MNLPTILGWKHNDMPGIRCQEDGNGVMRCVEFPGGMPTQEQIDTWTAEYAAYLASGAQKNEEAITQLSKDNLRKVLFEINFDQENRLLALEGKSAMNRVQYRNKLVGIYKTV